MPSPADVQGYAASLWRFVGGPVLRSLLLVVIVIYIYGAQGLRSALLGDLPELSTLTNRDLKEFMDMYGLGAVMPFIALVLFATLVHVINVTIFTVSNVLQPRLYTREDVTEVFSTDWSFGGGQDECRFGDGADSLRAQSDAAQRPPAGLEQRDPAFALGAQTADELIAGEVVRMQVAA